MTRYALFLEREATRRTLEEREAELARERAEVERLKAENAQLQHRIEVLERRMFGRSLERLTPG